MHPFGTVKEFKGKHYIQMGKFKPAIYLLAANLKAEICACAEGEWLRVVCKVLEDDRLRLRNPCLMLTRTSVICMTRMTATPRFCSCRTSLPPSEALARCPRSWSFEGDIES